MVHWVLRTTCSAVRRTLSAMQWVVRRGESWGNPKMSLVLCQLVPNPSHRQERGSPTFDQENFTQKITDRNTSLQTWLRKLLRNKAKMAFLTQESSGISKKLADLLGLVFTDKMFSEERFTIASHKFLQHRHKHWNHLHLLRSYTFAATRTPWIVKCNKSLSLVWFKWGSQWWGILKDFPQSRCILISHGSREEKQSSIIIYIKGANWFDLNDLFSSLFPHNSWCPCHHYH